MQSPCSKALWTGVNGFHYLHNGALSFRVLWPSCIFPLKLPLESPLKFPVEFPLELPHELILELTLKLTLELLLE